MPIFIKEGISCLFMHIPKAGGTSIEDAARKLGWKEHLSIRGVHANDLQFMKASPQHFHAELIHNTCNISHFNEVILISRHPYTRLKSEYYWQQAQGISKLEPLAWFEKITEQIQTNPYAYDNHLRPQVEYVIKSPNTKSFKLEEDGIKKTINVLLQYTKLPDALKPLILKRATAHHSKKSKKNNLVEEQFLALKKPIYNTYKRDFEHFKYNPDI